MSLVNTSQADGGAMTTETLGILKQNAVTPIFQTMRQSFADALTAHSGGTQAAALPITAAIARVTTVAVSGDSVLLPPSQPGLQIQLLNGGANAMQVFGSGTDTINGIATATGVSQSPGSVVVYTCLTAGAWYTDNTVTNIPSIALLAANGAIYPHSPQTYVITKAGVAAMTLAAPTATTDDGVILVVTSSTAFAHTITATGLLKTGAATVNVATFAAFAGATVTLMAYQGLWYVLSQNVVTFT